MRSLLLILLMSNGILAQTIQLENMAQWLINTTDLHFTELVYAIDLEAEISQALHRASNFPQLSFIATSKAEFDPESSFHKALLLIQASGEGIEDLKAWRNLLSRAGHIERLVFFLPMSKNSSSEEDLDQFLEVFWADMNYEVLTVTRNKIKLTQGLTGVDDDVVQVLSWKLGFTYEYKLESHWVVIVNKTLLSGTYHSVVHGMAHMGVGHPIPDADINVTFTDHSYLMRSDFERPVDTALDALEMDKDVWFYAGGGLEEELKSIPIPHYTTLSNKVIERDTIYLLERGLPPIHVEKEIINTNAVIVWHRNMMGTFYDKVLKRHNLTEQPFRTSKGNVYVYNVRYLLQLNRPWNRAINHVLLRMFETGYVDHFLKRYIPLRVLNMKDEQTLPPAAFKLEHFYAPFACLGLVILLGSLVLSCERRFDLLLE